MPYDFRLKKKLFGGLDPNSVTEYIAKIKAENNLLKKELAAQAEIPAADTEEVKLLEETISDLNSKVESYETRIASLKAKISELETKETATVPSAESSKLVVESFNLANHYIRSAVQISSEVSDTTIDSTEKSKETLQESIEALETFERTIRIVKAQVGEVIGKFDDVSDTFEKLKEYESLSLKPDASTADAGSGQLDDKAPLSLVD